VDVALMGLGTKDLDRVLAWIMLAFCAAAAAGVIYLLCRHHNRERKARSHAAHRGHKKH
jgi:hypothetical protein